MPPRKKHKTGDNSSAPVREEQAESAHDGETAEPNEVPKRKVSDNPPFEYVCVHHPLYDFELEVKAGGAGKRGHDSDEDGDGDGDDDDEDEEGSAFKKYKKVNEKMQMQNQLLEPAREHKDWKWVMLWDAWKMSQDWQRRSNYCQPDSFGMYIYNDFYGYGVQELLENLLLMFDAALKKKDTEDARWSMWAALSAMAHWLNAGSGTDYMMNDDGERTVRVSELVGTAVLTGLAAVEKSGELKADSKFLDLGIVITAFLHWAEDHENYGIEDEAVAWREHAVAYYERSGLGVHKGIAGTAELLKRFKGESPPAPDEAADPWGWTKKLKRYDLLYDMGGTRYDITKMSRKERAKHAFDNKDPLAGFSDKDIKEGNIDIQ